MLTYKKTGVDIAKADRFLSLIKPGIKTTHRKGVLQNIGGFGALFQIDFKQYRDPVIVATTDGVGTKLQVAKSLRRYDTIGIDLVAMSVNDLLAMGAEPLFFLDYVAMSSLHLSTATAVMRGIIKGCRQAHCALIGGETAELPQMYKPGDVELAGFSVGVVEKSKIIDGTKIRPGDVIIGLASTGLHSNGYSLARKALPKKDWKKILAPTQIYVRTVLSLLKKYRIHGMAHITGGGLTQNIPRILPRPCSAAIDLSGWKMPALFQLIQSRGRISQKEMLKTFNCGIGFVIVCKKQDSDKILSFLKQKKQKAFMIGHIVKRKGQTIVFR